MAGTYAIAGIEPTGRCASRIDQIERELRAEGWSRGKPEDAALVLNVIDPESPQSFRRRSRRTYVAGICELPESDLPSTYPLLV